MTGRNSSSASRREPYFERLPVTPPFVSRPAMGSAEYRRAFPPGHGFPIPIPAQTREAAEPPARFAQRHANDVHAAGPAPIPRIWMRCSSEKKAHSRSKSMPAQSLSRRTEKSDPGGAALPVKRPERPQPFPAALAAKYIFAASPHTGVEDPGLRKQTPGNRQNFQPSPRFPHRAKNLQVCSTPRIYPSGTGTAPSERLSVV